MSIKFGLNGKIHEILRITTTTTHKHKSLLQKRPESTKAACKNQIEETSCGACKENVCAYAKPRKTKKRGLFGLLGGKVEPEEAPPPPKETCKIELAKQQCQPVPNLREFGGQPYKTCGSAYIIQKHRVGIGAQRPQTKEEKILKKLEADPELKEKQEDPMPQFTSVEQRMMDLDARRLHPLYKKYQVTTRKMYKKQRNTAEYKTRSGPIAPEDYPTKLKFNKELLEKKNMYAEYKKVEPPQQLVAKILEIKQNERPTLERKFPQFDVELQKAKARKNVYDTLNQQDSITDKFVDK